jgi:hypothetical protein
MSVPRACLPVFPLLLALAAAVFCQAGEPKQADADDRLSAEATDQALEEIAAAYQMAAAGRKTGSPEALLAAAKILSRLGGKKIGLVKLEGVQPVKGKRGEMPRDGEAVKEEGQAVSFEAEIKKLKEDARKLNSPKDEHLAALIDQVSEKARGSIKGPKWMGPFRLEPSDDYNSLDWYFTFRGGEPAHVLVKNTGGRDLRLVVTRADQNVPRDKWRLLREVRGRSNLEARWRPQVTGRYLVTVWISNFVPANVTFVP